MNNQLTTIYVVRHGESLGNIAAAEKGNVMEMKRFGKGQSPLTPIGEQQAKTLADQLADIPFAAVFASPLTRAQQTATIIAKEKQLAVHTKEALQERMRGNLQGKSEEELRKEVGYIYGNPDEMTHEEWLTFKRFDDMESAGEIIARFITALREIAVAYPGQTVMVVSHGNIMRAFLVHLGYGTHTELSHNTIANTGYITIQTDGVDFFLKETQNVTKRIRTNEE